MRITFSATQAAAALWSYGEDALSERVLTISDNELRTLWAIAGDRWRPDHNLPLNTRLVLDKVTAFAAIIYFEGKPRPLTQERRRPANQMPEALRFAEPVPPGTMP